jgi:hypothetical protein
MPASRVGAPLNGDAMANANRPVVRMHGMAQCLWRGSLRFPLAARANSPNTQAQYLHLKMQIYRTLEKWACMKERIRNALQPAWSREVPTARVVRPSLLGTVPRPLVFPLHLLTCGFEKRVSPIIQIAF